MASQRQVTLDVTITNDGPNMQSVTGIPLKDVPHADVKTDGH